MSQCTKCGSRFIGTAANLPPDGLCRYCENDALKACARGLQEVIETLLQLDYDARRYCYETNPKSFMEWGEERSRAWAKARELGCWADK